MAQIVKKLPAAQETRLRSLGQEDSPGEGMAIHSYTLAWRIPWTEEPCEPQSTGLQRVGHDWVANTFTGNSTIAFITGDFWVDCRDPYFIINCTSWSACPQEENKRMILWVECLRLPKFVDYLCKFAQLFQDPAWGRGETTFAEGTC